MGSEPALRGTDAPASAVPLRRERTAWWGWRLLPWCLPHSEIVGGRIPVGGLGMKHRWHAQWSWYPPAGQQDAVVSICVVFTVHEAFLCMTSDSWSGSLVLQAVEQKVEDRRSSVPKVTQPKMLLILSE